jgi:arginine deiminase
MCKVLTTDKELWQINFYLHMDYLKKSRMKVLQRNKGNKKYITLVGNDDFKWVEETQIYKERYVIPYNVVNGIVSTNSFKSKENFYLTVRPKYLSKF